MKSGNIIRLSSDILFRLRGTGTGFRGPWEGFMPGPGNGFVGHGTVSCPDQGTVSWAMGWFHARTRERFCGPWDGFMPPPGNGFVGHGTVSCPHQEPVLRAMGRFHAWNWDRFPGPWSVFMP